MRLGGVDIPADFRLAGHSDGDAVCHAVTDAILGAAGLGDIGALFPDTDPLNKGRDSIEMLRLSCERLRAVGFRIINVDITIVTESPRIGPWRDAMRARLSEALGVSDSDVSIKGKSNEGMGWIGRGEGLACIAIASVNR